MKYAYAMALLMHHYWNHGHADAHELVEAVDVCLKSGETNKSLAEFLKTSATTISRLRGIGLLEQQYLIMIKEKRIGLSVAYFLSKLDPSRRMDAVKTLEGFPTKMLNDFVHFAKTESFDIAAKKAKELHPEPINFVILPLPADIAAKTKTVCIKNIILKSLDKPTPKDKTVHGDYGMIGIHLTGDELRLVEASKFRQNRMLHDYLSDICISQMNAL